MRWCSQSLILGHIILLSESAVSQLQTSELSRLSKQRQLRVLLWIWTQSSVWFEILMHSVDRCRQRSRTLVLILGAQCAARLASLHVWCEVGLSGGPPDYAHIYISIYQNDIVTWPRRGNSVSNCTPIVCSACYLHNESVFICNKERGFYVFMRLTPTLKQANTLLAFCVIRIINFISACLSSKACN
jgi:hypothetical protein